jgi:hypothetical protein
MSEMDDVSLRSNPSGGELTELEAIRLAIAEFGQESIPSHVSTLQAVGWLINEHREQVAHNEEVGEENRALADERDRLSARLESSNNLMREFQRVAEAFRAKLKQRNRQYGRASEEIGHLRAVLARHILRDQDVREMRRERNAAHAEAASLREQIASTAPQASSEASTQGGSS